jgi:hypothetical protein
MNLRFWLSDEKSESVFVRLSQVAHDFVLSKFVH